MGRLSKTGGVTPIGHHRIQLDFTIDGVRYRPTLPWIPHETNLRRGSALLARIKARIAAGTFIITEDFPNFRGRAHLRVPFCARTCGDVFDAFLNHEAARVARGDLAPITLAARAIADAHRCSKKTYNNAISALRRAFEFGFQDHPEQFNPARALKSARGGH
jgi:integrase